MFAFCGALCYHGNREQGNICISEGTQIDRDCYDCRNCRNDRISGKDEDLEYGAWKDHGKAAADFRLY